VQKEQAALERNHVGQIPLPKPPIGHWMAQNLERSGVTCKYGIVHMAYILDRYSLQLRSTEKQTSLQAARVPVLCHPSPCPGLFELLMRRLHCCGHGWCSLEMTSNRRDVTMSLD